MDRITQSTPSDTLEAGECRCCRVLSPFVRSCWYFTTHARRVNRCHQPAHYVRLRSCTHSLSCFHLLARPAACLSSFFIKASAVADGLTAVDRRYQKQSSLTIAGLAKHNDRMDKALHALVFAQERIDKVGDAMTGITAAVQRGDPGPFDDKQRASPVSKT